MKIRQGFVSNSSSSSFIIDTTNLSNELKHFKYYKLKDILDNLEKMLKILKDNGIFELYELNELLPEYLRPLEDNLTYYDTYDGLLVDYMFYKNIYDSHDNSDNLVMLDTLSDDGDDEEREKYLFIKSLPSNVRVNEEMI